MSSQHAATHFNFVIERGVVENMHGGMHGAGFGVLGAVYQCPDAGVNHGSGAHGAGLDGHEKIAVCQPVISDCRSGFTQSHDFCVSGGIGVSQVAVESAADDLTFMHYHGAYRYFSYIECSLTRAERLLHPQFVGFRTSAVSHEEYCMRQPSALAQMD